MELEELSQTIIRCTFQSTLGFCNYLKKDTSDQSTAMVQTPYSSVLDFQNSKFEKLSLTNWNFNLQKSISKLTFAG